MTDEELVKRLRSYAKDQGGWHNIDDTCEEAADRIKALAEQLEAARADAKEAEACAEELEKKVESLGREVNAARYGQPDFAWSIHKAAMADLEDKLAKAVEALRKIEGWPDYRSPSHQDIARTTLAEIEGGK